MTGGVVISEARSYQAGLTFGSIYNLQYRALTGFSRDNQILLCDGQSLEAIAAGAGTPCYVYSAPAIRARYRELDAAFAAHPHAIHYALKANSTLAIVRLLRGLGAHADANSGGEIDVALRAGFEPGE